MSVIVSMSVGVSVSISVSSGVNSIEGERERESWKDRVKGWTLTERGEGPSSL